MFQYRQHRGGETDNLSDDKSDDDNGNDNNNSSSNVDNGDGGCDDSENIKHQLNDVPNNNCQRWQELQLQNHCG